MSDSVTHFISSQETRLIPLSGKHGLGKFAIVDASDYEDVSRYTWHICAGGYVGGCVWVKEEKKKILLHRYLMKPSADMDVDHRNGNKLDHRRENLRVCKTGQNVLNRRKTKSPTSSRFAGVSFDKATSKWKANIGFEGRQINLGLYDDEIYAARVRDGAAEVLFGEFAPPRNVPDQEPIPYTHREKLEQSSSYKGVSFRKDCGKWEAFYCKNYKTRLIGYYLTEIDAARARDGMMIKLYGDQAERQVPDMEPIFDKPNKHYKLRSSQYMGVSWHKGQKKWNVIIPDGKKQKYVGSFTDEIEAARAYDEAVKLHLGETEKLNFKE